MDRETTQIRGREQFRKYKKLISLIVSLYRVFPTKTRIKLLERHRYMRGRIGIGIRYALLKSLAKSCGDNVGIGQGVYIVNPQFLSVGDNVSIHPMSYIDCGFNAENGLVIGSNVSIAHGSTIMDSTHSFQDLDTNIKDQPMLTIKTEICDNVWIGAKATIIAGNTVNRGCIVAAGAVVTKSTEEDCIYAGVPATIIKRR